MAPRRVRSSKHYAGGIFKRIFYFKLHEKRVHWRPHVNGNVKHDHFTTRGFMAGQILEQRKRKIMDEKLLKSKLFPEDAAVTAGSCQSSLWPKSANGHLKDAKRNGDATSIDVLFAPGHVQPRDRPAHHPLSSPDVRLHQICHRHLPLGRLPHQPRHQEGHQPLALGRPHDRPHGGDRDGVRVLQGPRRDHREGLQVGGDLGLDREAGPACHVAGDESAGTRKGLPVKK